MDNLFTQKIINANNLFDDDFLDGKMLYLYQFNRLPSAHFISGIDAKKAYPAIFEQVAESVQAVHQRKWYKKLKKDFEFDRTIIVLSNQCLIEMDDNWCEIFHDGNQDEFIQTVTKTALQFREKRRKKPLEINLIVQAGNRLELRGMEIKRTKLDLDLFYEEDFKEVDATIRSRLGKNKDRGIVLLHGLPGTGKTTYLRYLVGKIRKRVLFVSPTVAAGLTDPTFIQLLIDNPDTVLIIEDAEHIILDRRYDSNSSVSNLLNISDGLLADFLNVQLICTFNSSLTMVDNALLRKGRLIAKYEFGKLSVARSQRLSDHLGFKNLIQEPMTIAEIANQHEKKQVPAQTDTIGFRRQSELMN
jgi:hypothetical protein